MLGRYKGVGLFMVVNKKVLWDLQGTSPIGTVYILFVCLCSRNLFLFFNRNIRTAFGMLM